MAIQFSTAVRNARINAVEATIGTAPILEIRTGSPPANCAAADSGTLLATLTLPTDWENSASGGASTLLGTWQGLTLVAGTASHFRMKDSTGTTCHMQGTVDFTPPADLVLDDNTLVFGQFVTILTWTVTDANS